MTSQKQNQAPEATALTLAALDAAPSKGEVVLCYQNGALVGLWRDGWLWIAGNIHGRLDQYRVTPTPNPLYESLMPLSQCKTTPCRKCDCVQTKSNGGHHDDAEDIGC